MAENASKILSNANAIAAIYKIIKDSAILAVAAPQVKTNASNVCILKSGGPLRAIARCTLSTSHTIEYDPNDLVVIGGAALNVYDFKLRELKDRRGLAALEEYIKKKTTDIDIVWWPRVKSDDVIITSRSEAIIELVSAFKNALIQAFNANKDSLQIYLGPAASINIELTHTALVGVYYLSIFVIYPAKTIKICEILIHDSGASQRYDDKGREITTLNPMTTDPVYCSPIPGTTNSISYLNVAGVDIAVPNIESFIYQQMFAFDNLVKTSQLKSFINYKRTEFFRIIFSRFELDNPNNNRNYRELMEIFGTDNEDYPRHIFFRIAKRQNESIIRYYKEIIELCKKENTTHDSIVFNLCAKAKIVSKKPEIEAYVSKEIKRLEDIKTLVWNKFKGAHIPEQKAWYMEIYETVNRRINSLLTITLFDAYKYKKYYEEHPNENIRAVEYTDEYFNPYWGGKTKRNKLRKTYKKRTV
jgi:hypothetical protein